MRSFSLKTTLCLSTLVLGTLGERLVSGQDDGPTGDRLCSRSMCVSAIMKGQQVDYVMTSTSKNVGWMSVPINSGFGRAMGHSPMVVMWPNSDGTVTISQRSSKGHSTPTVDSNPTLNAVVSQTYTKTSGSMPQLAFTITTNTTNTKPFIIWAYGSENPQSSSPDANFDEHDDMGAWQLDLTRPITLTSNGALPNFPSQPMYPYQRLIVAHAVLCALGFLLFLPAGALLARYLRVFNPIWFQGHWIIQFAFAAPIIVVGVGLGVGAVQTAGAMHFGDQHRKYGALILVLYLAQCALGAFIHFVKNKNRTRRPIQNYLHGLVGIITIGVGMYQIYNGFYKEWANTTGRGPLGKGLTVVFWMWCALVVLAYAAGLSLLPRQYRQENNSRRLSNRQDSEEYIRMASQPDLYNPGQGNYPLK